MLAEWAFNLRVHAPDVSRVTPSMVAQATWHEAKCMFGRQQVATCWTRARYHTRRLATNWTHHASRIKTKYIEDVPEIEAGSLHVDRCLVESKGSCRNLLQSNREVGNGSSLRDVRVVTCSWRADDESALR